MNIFELLPREDYSDEEAPMQQSRGKADGRQDQPGKTAKIDKPARNILTDSNSVWVAKPGQTPAVERVDQKTDKRVADKKYEQSKADTVASKDAGPVASPQNADTKEKTKKKKVVRIVETGGVEQEGEVQGEDIILLDQYLKEKYTEDEFLAQNTETEPSVQIDFALTDQMKKLGLKPSQKKESIVRKISKKANVVVYDCRTTRDWSDLVFSLSVTQR